MQKVMRLDARSSDFERDFGRLLAAKREVSEDVDTAAAAIIADVVARGDEALIDLSHRFDRVDLRTPRPQGRGGRDRGCRRSRPRARRSRP